MGFLALECHFMKLMVLTWTLAIAAGYVVFETLACGPYITWYNYRLAAIAKDHNLVGQNQGMVSRVLGDPSYIYRSSDDWGPYTTYNYEPFGFIPAWKVQVHCRKGVVEGIELFHT